MMMPELGAVCHISSLMDPGIIVETVLTKLIEERRLDGPLTQAMALFSFHGSDSSSGGGGAANDPLAEAARKCALLFSNDRQSTGNQPNTRSKRMSDRVDIGSGLGLRDEDQIHEDVHEIDDVGKFLNESNEVDALIDDMRRKQLMRDSKMGSKSGRDTEREALAQQQLFNQLAHQGSGMRVLLTSGIFLPDSDPKRWWDLVTLLLFAYCAVEMPLRCAFTLDINLHVLHWLRTIAGVVDVLFIVDLWVSARTAFVEEGQVVRRTSLIRHRFLSTWALLDVVAAIPFSVVAIAAPSLWRYGGLGVLFMLNRILVRMPHAFEQLRTLKLSSLPLGLRSRMERGTVFNPGLLRVCRLVLVLALFVHLTGCLWWYISIAHEGLPPNGWNPEAWLRAGEKTPLPDGSAVSRFLAGEKTPLP